MGWYPLDGKSREVRQALSPDGCDRDTNERAFAVLCLAAAECAARYTDRLDLQEQVPEDVADRWNALMSLLLDMGHWATMDAGARDDLEHLESFFHAQGLEA